MKTHHILSVDSVHTKPHDELLTVIKEILNEKDIPYENIEIFASSPKEELVITIKETNSLWYINNIETSKSIKKKSLLPSKKTFSSHTALLSYLEPFQHDYFITMVEN